MYLIRGIGNLAAFKKKFPNITMSGTIGNFDGLHLGHQIIVKNMLKCSKKNNLPIVVITFDPHTKSVIKKDK